MGDIKPENQINIVILGVAGSGKSRIGNIILGSKSHFNASVPTKSVEKAFSQRSEKSICVVDTPGYYSIDEEIIKEDLNTCLNLTAPGPHIILLCIKMDRFTDQATQLVNLITKILGTDIYKHMIVVFTHIDQWEIDSEEKGLKDLSFEDYIRTLPRDMINILKHVENRYFPLNNRKTGFEMQKQCDDLLSEIEDLNNLNNNMRFVQRQRMLGFFSDGMQWFLNSGIIRSMKNTYYQLFGQSVDKSIEGK